MTAAVDRQPRKNRYKINPVVHKPSSKLPMYYERVGTYCEAFVITVNV